MLASDFEMTLILSNLYREVLSFLPYGFQLPFLFYLAHRCVASTLLALALAAPASLPAAPKPQEATVQVRVYDQNHKDYHHWDAHENAAWERCNVENQRKSYEWAKAKTRKGKKRTGTGATAIPIRPGKIRAINVSSKN
jgi:hypothetical protein